MGNNPNIPMEIGIRVIPGAHGWTTMNPNNCVGLGYPAIINHGKRVRARDIDGIKEHVTDASQFIVVLEGNKYIFTGPDEIENYFNGLFALFDKYNVQNLDGPKNCSWDKLPFGLVQGSYVWTAVAGDVLIEFHVAKVFDEKNDKILASYTVVTLNSRAPNANAHASVNVDVSANASS